VLKISLPADTPKGQLEAITADEKIITVEAGAGTGKTWVLSQRYLRLLLDDDDLMPSDILTLTYTEAAAGEMKARIESLITESLERFPVERRQKILDGLSDTWISTIHSFAGRLIRESGLSLDIDPKASVISPHQEQAFWEDVRNAAQFASLSRMARNYTGGEILKAAKFLDRDEVMSSAVSKWGAKTLSDFAKDCAELHASSGHSWEDMMKWADDDSEIVSVASEIVRDILRSEWRKVWSLFYSMELPRANNPNGNGARLNNLLAEQKSQEVNDSSLEKFYRDIVLNESGITANAGQPFAALSENLGMTLGNWRNSQPSAVKAVTENFSAPLTKQEKQMRSALMKFCAVSWGMWDMMKSKRGLLSFSDMILHAKRTVEKQGIRRTFKHILVDEFQDTDPLQFGMIYSLKGYREDSSLFAVGDPKQSIYKFRHADPSLFAHLSGRSDTKKVSLDQSFRTRAGLLAKINTMFKNLWPHGISRQPSMMGVKYNILAPFDYGNERESGTMPEFDVYLLRNDYGSAESKKILAEHIASKISSWVKGGFTVWDKKNKIIRPVKFSDFAILSRGRGAFTILEEALESFGVPSLQDRSSNYFNRGEIGDVVCTLRAAADMSDNFSVTGWLMSPFSGVKEDDAVTKCLAIVDKKHSPIDLIRENLPDAYALLEKLSVIGEHEGASGILSYYDNNRKWLSCYSERDRLRVLRNVRLALGIAREFQSSVGGSLVSCAEYMTRSVRNEASLDEPSWHDEDENAVRLGAVHSAKGLEYPVTVIFEDRTRKKIDSSKLRASRELGLVFNSVPDEISGSENLAMKFSQWHRLLSEQGDEEEEERLFYVACTRAQDSLIFCGLIKPLSRRDIDAGDFRPKGYDGTWSEFLLRSIEGMNDVTPEIIDRDNDLPGRNADKTHSAEEFSTVELEKAERALRQFSATSFALFEWCPFAWRRKYRQGRTLEWEMTDRENNDDVVGGAELGSLVHWILSKINFSGDYETEIDHYLHDKNEILSRLPGHIRDAWRRNDRNEKSQVKEWLMNFIESETGIMMRDTQGVEREHRFRISLDGKTVLAGAVDAVIDDMIVDYKITEVNDVPPGLYESQMDFYAYVIHDMKKLDRVRTIAVFLKENETRERVITDFEGIRERIARAAEMCASDSESSYNAKTEHCGLCPFKKGCVKNAGTIQE